MCVISAALTLSAYDENTTIEGVAKEVGGRPTGKLQEMAAMFPLMRRLCVDFREHSQREGAICAYGRMAVQACVKTMTDLFSSMTNDDLSVMQQATSEADFPLRIVPVLGAVGGQANERAAQIKQLATQNSEKLRPSSVKFLTDGCRSALDANLPMAVHSDVPVTPLGPLFTAWCAVTHQTMSG